MKKRGLDFITGCGYTIESFAGLQKKDIAFLFITLSVMADITLKSITSRPIIMFKHDKFSALDIFVLWEDTAKHKSKSTCCKLIAVVS